MYDVVSALGVAADSDIFGEYSYSGWGGERLLVPVRGVHVLVVRARRRASGSGQPVEHYIGEDDVAVDRLLRQLVRGVAPHVDLLRDPCQLTRWRVVERVG